MEYGIPQNQSKMPIYPISYHLNCSNPKQLKSYETVLDIQVEGASKVRKRDLACQPDVDIKASKCRQKQGSHRTTAMLAHHAHLKQQEKTCML